MSRDASASVGLSGVELPHTFACSDEKRLETWIENPYWQTFCGETYFQHEAPIDPSPLTRWRKRIGVDRSPLVSEPTPTMPDRFCVNINAARMRAA